MISCVISPERVNATDMNMDATNILYKFQNKNENIRKRQQFKALDDNNDKIGIQTLSH